MLKLKAILPVVVGLLIFGLLAKIVDLQMDVNQCRLEARTAAAAVATTATAAAEVQLKLVAKREWAVRKVRVLEQQLGAEQETRVEYVTKEVVRYEKRTDRVCRVLDSDWVRVYNASGGVRGDELPSPAIPGPVPASATD